MKKLSRSQLKRIQGGDESVGGASSCTASCEGAQPITKNCGTNSTCTATDNVGVKCNDEVPQCCYSGTPCNV